MVQAGNKYPPPLKVNIMQIIRRDLEGELVQMAASYPVGYLAGASTIRKDYPG